MTHNGTGVSVSGGISCSCRSGKDILFNKNSKADILPVATIAETWC
jgi:hypothetical protein